MGPGRARASHGPRVSNPVLKDTAPVRAALDRRASRLLKKAHLLRWRPRSHAQRTESTPRVRPSGAASQLTPSRHPARSSVAWKCRRLRAHLLRWRPRQQVQRTESTPHLLPSGAASQLNPFERPAPSLSEAAGVRPLAASTLVERVVARIGTFAELSKFGIVLLVLVSAGAGFMLSAPLGTDFPWMHGLVVLLGV